MKYLFILYDLVGVLTFGRAFVDIEAETRAECADRPFCFPKEVATYGGLLSGIAWPLYWSAEAARWVRS